ncbi:glycosyltransferase [Candidatus Saccharibacteria bacterium]|nr:glycosyltransferase [Candidatus Saccharibacteria bacterium]
MKSVIASDIYYPMINGVAVFAHNLANGLSKAGHEVIVIAPSFNGKYHVDVDKETGVTTYHLTSARFPLYPDQINKVPDKKTVLGLPMPRLAYKHGIWWSVNPWSEVKHILNDFQPDVIHLQTAETIALAVMSYVRKNDVPLVSTGHAYPDNVTGQFKLLKPKLIKMQADAVLRVYMASFLKHAEYATMPTEMAIGDLVPKNRKRFKVTVEALSNGVDLSEFYPGKPNPEVLKKYGLSTGSKKRVLYIGRVDPEKSIGTVVEAFSKTLKKVPDAELVIVGDGIDVNHLKELVSELNISDKVIFPGKILPPDLVEVYRSGMVFATASETETQGIVLIEAAATGLPLIAVNKGAVYELCQDKRNGFLCEPGGDVDGISDAMVKILTDKNLREKFSKESIEVSKKHDLNRTLKRFEEIYHEAIKLKSEHNTIEE